jgi:hypothetical protein
MQLVSSSIYSQETAYLLSLAVYSKDSKSFAIAGLPVKTRDNPYTPEEILFLKTLEEYLIYIGGTVLKVDNLLFCYIFNMDNRRSVLEWYLSLTGADNYNELEKKVKIEEKKDSVERIITLDDEKSKILFLDGVGFFLTSQKSILSVWNKETYTRYIIKLYNETDDIPTEDKAITHMISISTKRIVVTTKRGEIFFLDVDEGSYQLVKTVPLISFVKSIVVADGRVIVGLEDNTIQLYDHVGKLLSILNKENIYQSYTIFSMGIFHLKVSKSHNELMAISYNIYDNNYHFLVFDLNTFLLKRKLSLGDSPITGLVCTMDKIFISSLDGEIKVISRQSDELTKMDIEGATKIYKMIKIVNTNNIIVLNDNGLDAISYPDKHYHIPDSEEHKITSLLSLNDRLIVGREDGSVHVYDGKLNISKDLFKVPGVGVADLFPIDSRIAVTSSRGTITIVK